MRFKASEFNSKRPPEEIVEALDLWRTKINTYILDLMKDGRPLTADSLREVIQTGGVKAYTVGNLFDDYLRILKKRVGIDLKESVYRKYELTAHKALSFCRRDANVSVLTPSLIQTIICDLRAVYDPATVVGYVTRLKTFCKFALDNDRLKINPFQGVKISKPKKEIQYLTEEEVEKIYDYIPTTDRMRKIKDLFLIQIWTGMAYADLMTFTKDDLKTEGSHSYIKKKRVKTGNYFLAIVFPFAVPIINYYTSLPKISNQKYNKGLKELQKEVGLTKNLTTHLGRRTYATALINRGADITTVASALGDNPQVASQYYAKVFDKTILQKQISTF